jgi:tripartite-type tricarboxylate transporter receptor subunit TctC
MEETMPGVTSITWMAVSAPPGTPREITKKISDAIGNGFKQPDMQARILKLDADPLGSTPDAMRQMIQESTDIWGPVVKAANIAID